MSTPTVDFVTRLRDQARDIERILAGLDEAAAARRVVPDKWSLKELVAHVWRVQQVFEERIEAMLAEEHPPIVSYEPEGDPGFDRLAAQPAAELTRGFLESRERLAARLAGLDPAAWGRTGRHPEFRRYDVAFQVEYMAWHEAHHIYQMIQRRAAL